MALSFFYDSITIFLFGINKYFVILWDHTAILFLILLLPLILASVDHSHLQQLIWWCLSNGDFSVFIMSSTLINGILLYGRADVFLVCVCLFIYWLIHLFISLWSQGYLCYSVGHNPLISLFCCLNCSGFSQWKLL